MPTRDSIEEYRQTTFNQVYGWVGPAAVNALESCAAFQENLGLRGDALEIGVFHGRFFLALMSAIRPNEIAVAVDIFDDQELNVDKSGHEANLRALFTGNVNKFARNPECVNIIPGDSMTIRADQIMSASSSGAFRFISVDGGHTAEHVMNDLALASQIIVGGGAIFLDDFHNPHWPGVFEGFVRYMTFTNRNLAPVLYTSNKLILTTISHQPLMLEFMRTNFLPADGSNIAEVKLNGFNYIAYN